MSPFSRVDNSNSMPTNGLRVVDRVHKNIRSREYVQKQNIREIYSSNLSPASASSTENYLKSK